MILQQLGSELLAAIMAILHRLLAFFLANDANVMVLGPVFIIFSIIAYIWVFSKDEEESEVEEFDQLHDYLFAEQAHYFWIGFGFLLASFFSLVIRIQYGDAISKWMSELSREDIFVASLPVFFICCSFYAFTADPDLLSSWYTSDSANVSNSDDLAIPTCVTKHFMDQLLDNYIEMKAYEADSLILIKYLEGKLEMYDTLGPVNSDGCLVSLEEYKLFADNEKSQAELAIYKSYVDTLEALVDVRGAVIKELGTDVEAKRLKIQELEEEITREKGSLMEELWRSVPLESINRHSLRPFSDGFFSARGKSCEEVDTAPQQLLRQIEHKEASVQESAAPQHLSDQVNLNILETSGPTNPPPLFNDNLLEQDWEAMAAEAALPETELGEEAALSDPEQDGMRTSTSEGSSDSDDEDAEDENVEDEEDEDEDNGNEPDDDNDDDDDHSNEGGSGSIISQTSKDSAEDDRSHSGGSSEHETSHSSQSEEANSSIDTEPGDDESDDTNIITGDNKPDSSFYRRWNVTSAEPKNEENSGDPVETNPPNSSTAAEPERAGDSQEPGSEEDEIKGKGKGKGDGDGEANPGDHVETDLPDSSTTTEAKHAAGSQESVSVEDEIEVVGETSPVDSVETDIQDSSTTAEAESADGSQEPGSEDDEIEDEGVVDGEVDGEGQGQRKRTRRGGRKRKNPVKRQQERDAQEELRVKQAQQEQRAQQAEQEQQAQQAQQEEREGGQSVRQATATQTLFPETSTPIVKLSAGPSTSPGGPEGEQSAQDQQPRQELQEIGQSLQHVETAQKLFPSSPNPPRVSLPPSPPQPSRPGLAASRWAPETPSGPSAKPTGRVVPTGLKYLAPKGPRGRQ